VRNACLFLIHKHTVFTLWTQSYKQYLIMQNLCKNLSKIFSNNQRAGKCLFQKFIIFFNIKSILHGLMPANKNKQV
jgi:hypothetical protein